MFVIIMGVMLFCVDVCDHHGWGGRCVVLMFVIIMGGVVCCVDFFVIIMGGSGAVLC